jgi:hypothetical protein
MKSYEEMVREAEQVKGTECELEGLVPVKARVAKDVRHVFLVADWCPGVDGDLAGSQRTRHDDRGLHAPGLSFGSSWRS